MPMRSWNRTELKAVSVAGKRLAGLEARWCLVAHTVETGENGLDETIRIISARRANRGEKRRYEKERQKDYG